MTMAPHNERDGSAINSMLSIVIDPDALSSRDGLLREAAAFLDYARTSGLRAGFEEVLLPGEPEQRARDERAGSIPLDAGTLGQLRSAAERAGVPAADVGELLGR
jgi:uncharacterized oxidoreductase